MFYDLITLDPNTYLKKSKKSTNFSESVEFIGILQKKLTEWNIKFSCRAKAGIAHKIKYDQFDNVFLKESHLIVYIVSLFSEVGFRDSIKKLITTCEDKEKLNRIIIISLDKSAFAELNETVIDLIHFGGNAWKSEDDNGWSILQDKLIGKLRKVESNNECLPQRTNVGTMPLPIAHQKSPSKIKSFFNSLPTKFDLEKKMFFRDKMTKEMSNESVPNIQISTSNDDSLRPIDHSHKEDHSKLSLRSLFRKRSRKARDSGVSGNSSLSNGSDSRNSKCQSNEFNFDVSSEPSPSCERSAVLHSSSLDKTKSYKAKIHMFRDKASKYLHSASCLNSPENKRRKEEEQIVAFSDILLPDLKPRNGLVVPYQRGQSEPPNHRPISPNGMLKFYSWDADLDQKQSFLVDHVIISSLFESTNQTVIPLTSLGEVDDIWFNDKLNDEDTENGKVVEPTDEIDGNYFQVQYAKNVDSSPRKPGKHSVTFKIEGLDSLENIMESIQRSCDEMKLRSDTESTMLKTFKSGPRNSSPQTMEVVELIDEKKSCRQEFTPTGSDLDRVHVIDCTIPSTSGYGAPRSLLYRTTETMANNPFLVMGLFTATAFTAPLWSSYIPHDVQISHFFLGSVSNLLSNDIFQWIPRQLTSAVSLTTSTATNSLRRLFVAIPNGHSLFGGYKIMFF